MNFLKRWHRRGMRWHWYKTWHQMSMHRTCHWVMLVIFTVGIFMGSVATIFYKNGQVTAQVATPSTGMWIPNDIVRTVAVGGDGTVYIGGDFTHVGPNTGSGMPVNTSTGAVTTSFPFVNGDVNVVVSDGSSGWFIGGAFTKVGSTSRNGLAHLNSSGVVDSTWDPNPNGTVYTLASDGTNLYVGGSFTSIGGSTRNRLAAVSLTGAGTATTWNPNANSTVYSLVINPLVTKIYAGGDFTTIGATTRNRVASFTLSDGALETWNPDVNGTVRVVAIHSNGGILYVGGTFTTVNTANSNTARNNLAAFNTNLAFGDANVMSWDPNANGTVLAIVYNHPTVYVAGAFTTIGGTARNRIASVDNLFGAVNAWDPNANGTVNAILLSGTTMYVGGAFTTFGSTPTTRNYVAALDTATNTNNTTSFDPNTGAAVNALALSGSNLFVGGSFLSIGGVTRNRLAAINPSTGQATSWNPNTSAAVNALIVSGSTVYAGGSFTTVNGSTTRNRLAAFDTTGGTATSWDPNLGSTVNTLSISGSTVYAGGSFTTVNGSTTRNRLAAFDTSSSTATSWNPNVSDAVQTMAISGTTLYVGGTFITISGVSRNNLAAVSISDTGTATTWNPNANSTVNTLSISGSTVYAGGSFTTVNGGTTRNRLASFDTTNGTATGWNPNTSGLVRTVLATSSTLYAGGDFNGANAVNGSTTRNYLAAFDTASGTVRSWDPNPNNSVYALAMSSATLYLGGNFTTLGSSNLSRLTWFAPPTVAFTSASQTAAEGAGTVNITVQLSAASSQDISVPFTLSGTATGSGTDYSITASPLTISAGSLATTITVTLVDDLLDEDDETVIVTMGTPTNATAGATTTHTITITDNDPPPTVSFSAATSSGLESVTPSTFTIALSTVSAKTVTVAYATANGTATAGSDYTAVSGTATIAAGSTSTTVNVSVIDDGLNESNETFTITLSSPSNATLGSTTIHTYTIVDNDGIPGVTFSTSSSSGAETVTAVAIPVTLTAVSGQNVSVNYAVTGGTATGGGVDYTLASGTATITAGSTSTNINLTLVADALDEPDETIIITLSNPVNTSLGSLTTFTYTINGSNAFLPVTPSNTVPADGASSVSLAPTLTASNFSDAGGDAHSASQWQVSTVSGNFSHALFDSGTDTTNRTSLTLPPSTLVSCTLYYWRVHYLDGAGGWSNYSNETSFKTTGCGSAASSAAAAAAASATNSMSVTDISSGGNTGTSAGLSATVSTSSNPTNTAPEEKIVPVISDLLTYDTPSSYTGALSATAIQISLTDNTPANAREYRLYRGKHIYPGRLRIYPGRRQEEGQTIVITIDSLTPNTQYSDFFLTKVTSVGIESESLPLPAVTTSVAPLTNVQLQPVATASGELRGVVINFGSANPPSTEYQVTAVSGDTTYYLNTTGRLRREPVWFKLEAWPKNTIFFLPPRQAGRYTLLLKARNRDLVETNFISAGTVQVDL